MVERLGVASGLVAMVLLVWSSAMFSGVQASPEDSDAAIFAELIEVGDDAANATFVAMWAIPFLVAFGGVVADRFRRHGSPGWIGSVFVSGTVLLGVSFMLIGGVAQMASTLEGVPGAEGIARHIVIYGWNSAFFFVPGILAIGASAVLATVEANALPRPLGYSAVVVVVAAFTPWIGVFVLVLWIAVASVVLTFDKAVILDRSFTEV
ncbi:MAG: hypothetical protein WD990_05840 [Acidimicrobiia bacterium]